MDYSKQLCRDKQQKIMLAAFATKLIEKPIAKSANSDYKLIRMLFEIAVVMFSGDYRLLMVS